MGRALEIRASFMRGGTSKGVFFHTVDLPAAAQRSTRVRDQMLLRIVGRNACRVWWERMDGFTSV